jgi:hypothetical protein
MTSQKRRELLSPNGHTIEEVCRLLYRNHVPPEEHRRRVAVRVTALEKKIAAVKGQPDLTDEQNARIIALETRIARIKRQVYQAHNTLPLTKEQWNTAHIVTLEKSVDFIETRAYETPNEEAELDKMVVLLLKYMHREFEGQENEPVAEEPRTPQGKKHYDRWSLVAWAHNEKGLPWRKAYDLASRVLGKSDMGGKPRTMKESYQLV